MTSGAVGASPSFENQSSDRLHESVSVRLVVVGRELEQGTRNREDMVSTEVGWIPIVGMSKVW